MLFKTISGTLFVVFMLISSVTSAQVNSERLRRGSSKAGFHGMLDGSFALLRGNVNYLQLGTSLRLEYNHAIHTPLLLANYAIAQVNDKNFQHRLLVHSRWTAMWHPRVGSELFAQYQFDQFLRLQNRFVTGVGIRVAIFLHKIFTIHAASGYMFEYEQLRLTEEETQKESHPREQLNHRWTNYLTMTLRLLPSFQISHTLFFQPRFDDFLDFRILYEIDMTVRIYKILFFVVGLGLHYDNRPPSTVVQSFDFDLWNRLRVVF